jgi:alkaline phosphatase
MSMQAFAQIVTKYREDHPGEKASFDEMLGIIKENFGLGTEKLQLSEYEKKQLEEAFKLSMQLPESLEQNEKNDILYGGNDPLSVTAAKLLDAKSGIGWTTFDHTAIPVPLRALGKGQEMFEGFQDNTDVMKKILIAAGI